VTFAILKVVDLLFGVRVNEEVEIAGLDRAVHREAAYNQA
jgi:Amt family ammonium transporter